MEYRKDHRQPKRRPGEADYFSKVVFILFIFLFIILFILFSTVYFPRRLLFFNILFFTRRHLSFVFSYYFSHVIFISKDYFIFKRPQKMSGADGKINLWKISRGSAPIPVFFYLLFVSLAAGFLLSNSLWDDMEVPSESFHWSSWDSRTCLWMR